jgi:hypothetical protein
MRLRMSGLVQSLLLRSFAVAVAACSVSFHNATAQFGGVFGNRGVGGVMIDSNGVLRNATAEDQTLNLEKLRGAMHGAQGDLAKATDLRLVSLKGIQQIALESQKKGNPRRCLLPRWPDPNRLCIRLSREPRHRDCRSR